MYKRRWVFGVLISVSVMLTCPAFAESGVETPYEMAFFEVYDAFRILTSRISDFARFRSSHEDDAAVVTATREYNVSVTVLAEFYAAAFAKFKEGIDFEMTIGPYGRTNPYKSLGSAEIGGDLFVLQDHLINLTIECIEAEYKVRELMKNYGE